MFKRPPAFLLLFPLVIGLFLAAAAPVSAKAAGRVHKEYYDNGNPRLFLRFKNDLIVRKRVFYRNGRLKLDNQYRDGLTLKMRDFYETGELYSIWTKDSGETRFYYRNGTLKNAVKSGDQN